MTTIETYSQSGMRSLRVKTTTYASERPKAFAIVARKKKNTLDKFIFRKYRETVKTVFIESISQPSTLFFFMPELGSNTHELIRPIPVLVEQIDDSDYVASIREAFIGASGETIPESIAELGRKMIRTLEHLNAIPLNQLGPIPKTQLQLLRSYIRMTPGSSEYVSIHHYGARQADHQKTKSEGSVSE